MTLPANHSLHVVHLDHTTEHGGAELALLRLLQNPHRGWRATLIVPDSMDLGVFDGVESKGVFVEKIGGAHPPGATKAGLSGALAVAWSLLRQASKLRRSPTLRTAEVVHANSTRSALYAAIALVGTRTPLVVHLRDRIEVAALGRFGYWAFRLIVAPRTTTFIANSAATAKTVQSALRKHQSVTTISSAIGVDKVTKLRPPNTKPRIGMVARLDDWKGQDLLIQAFANAQLDEVADLVFYGDAAFGKEAYAADLRALTASLGLKNVEFAGFVSDVQSAIDSLDVCVQYSTRPEPLGQNVLQYLARGKAVIAAAEGGPAEWIVNGENGLLVRPRSVPALSDALIELAAHAGSRESLEHGALNTDGLPTDDAIAAAHALAFASSADVSPSIGTVLAWPRSTRDNPYTRLLYEALEEYGVASNEFSIRRALTGSYDLLHVHWPEGVINGSPIRALTAAMAQRAVLTWVRVVRRKPIVWTVHNLQPHSEHSAAALNMVRSTLRRGVSGVLFLSNASRLAAYETFPWLEGVRSSVTLHGRYGVKHTPEHSRQEIRAALGIDESQRVVAFLGRAEPYKGLDALAAALGGANDPQVRLLVAGRIPDSTYGDRVRRLLESCDAIVEEGWVADEHLAELADASDLVVYPYRSILNSGSILFPLEFGTRVLAPAQGSIPEMASLIGSRWIHTFSHDLDRATIIDSLQNLPAKGERPDMGALSWERIASQTADFYRSVIPTSHQTS